MKHLPLPLEFKFTTGSHLEAERERESAPAGPQGPTEDVEAPHDLEHVQPLSPGSWCAGLGARTQGSRRSHRAGELAFEHACVWHREEARRKDDGCFFEKNNI